jgi:glycerate dehydrogenase
MKRKIVVLDGYGMNPGDLSWESLNEFGDVVVYDRTEADDVIGRSKDADIILTNKVVLSDEIINSLEKLRYVGVLATGYNVVDTVSAYKHGIVVTNIPAYSIDSVAQMTFAHILNITNRIGHYASENTKGKWSSNNDFCYWDTNLMELSGKILGIVGLGNIGKEVANIGAAFGLDIFAYTSKNSSELPSFVQKDTLEGLFSHSDIITLHCPLNEQTREIINYKTLNMMKDGVILINTSRGQLINEPDVADALNSGKLLGYGADVLSTEPADKFNPLLKCPNAFITPHIAWATLEARTRLMNVAVQNIKAFIEQKPINVVNR